MKRSVRLLTIVVAAALVASACAGSAGSATEGSRPSGDSISDAADPEETSAPTNAEASAAPAPTDETSATDGAGTDDDGGTSRTERPPTTDRVTTTTRQAAQSTTTETLLPRVPLVGQVLADGETAPDRPALVVKIDNAAPANPQSGLNEADIVFEEVVEFGITRFAAVFHSQGSNPVGPIRSGRTQDVDLLGGLNQPLFAWSGGNSGVEQAIAGSDLVNLNAQFTPGYYRSSDRQAPHNLFSNTDALWARSPAGASPPTAMFQYLDPREQVPGEGVDHTNASGAEMFVGSVRVRWYRSPESGTYLRDQNGSQHYTASTGQVSTDNVVVLKMQYVPSRVDARSPEAVTIGEGPAWVLTGGKVVAGHWERDSRTGEFHLIQGVGADARPIKLAPGRTFVELIDRTAPDPTIATG